MTTTLGPFRGGNTPLMKLLTQSDNIGCNIWGKCEWFNPTGSVKYRSAYYILKSAEAEGRLHAGMTIVESTSGNFGLALAELTKNQGYMVMCLVDKRTPKVKVDELRAAGIQTRLVAHVEGQDTRIARIELARQLGQKPGYFWTNQYGNPASVMAHYETTGPEIWRDTQGKVDAVVCAVGTGGTITGVGRFLKTQNPDICVVGVEPDGSVIFGGSSKPYLTTGAGMPWPSEIIKPFLRSIDFKYKVADAESIEMALLLRKQDGISTGVTSGMALAGAFRVLSERQLRNIAVILPDNSENYKDVFADYEETLSLNSNHGQRHSKTSHGQFSNSLYTYDATK